MGIVPVIIYIKKLLRQKVLGNKKKNFENENEIRIFQVKMIAKNNLNHINGDITRPIGKQLS